MTISVKSIISQGTLPVGATVNFLDASGLTGSGSTFVANNSTFLRSGYLLSSDASGTYPEAFSKIATQAGANVVNVRQINFPSAQRYNSAAYGNNTFVAVSGRSVTSNVAATSPDGITWTERTLPATSEWYSVAFGNNTFVAVTTTAVAATSPNGITWTQRTLPSSQAWQSCAFGNGLFVAVPYGGSVVATSPDGITWTQRTLPVSSSWNSCAFGNGVFVIVSSSANIVLSSPDGITWTQRTIVKPAANTGANVSFGNGVFLIAFTTTTTSYLTSTDGAAWTQRNLPESVFAVLNAFGSSTFMVGDGSAILYSSDLVSWQKLTFTQLGSPQSMIIANNVGVILPFTTANTYAFNMIPILRVGLPAEIKANGTVLYVKIK